jgi:hypothetical protein
MSNHTNDPWEVEMSRTFDSRVRDLNEAPLSLDSVKGKAGRIRRNRRIAVAGGIVAAAAMIVPVVTIGGDLLHNDSAPPIAKKDKTTEHAKDTSGSFGYIDNMTVHLADGTKMTLPDRYQSGVALGTTFYGVRTDDRTGQLFLDAIGEDVFPTQTTEISFSPVVTDDQSVIAYLTADNDLVTRDEDGNETSTKVPANTYPTAVTADAVYLKDGMGGPPLALDPQTGTTQVVVPKSIGVQDVDDAGLLTLQSSYSDQGSCGGIYDTAASDYVWKTCDYYLYSLSPGSAYVNATHAYLDGPGNGFAAILDATTGEEITRFTPPEGSAVTTTAWQDSEHLLATVSDNKTTSVYRIGVDGQSQRVLGPAKGSTPDSPAAYVLLGGR